MSTVAVVLLTMNQCDKTLRCLESLSSVQGERPKVLLWDNGSTDGTEDAVGHQFPEVLVHRHATNVGVAKGRNGGAALATERWDPEYLLFIDNDMIVEPDAISRLLEAFVHDPRIGISTGKIRVLGDPERLYGAGGCLVDFRRARTGHVGHGALDTGQYDVPGECIASGGCLMVRATLFRQLGGFDEQFSPYGPEDLDFGFRARKAGMVGWYVPGAVVLHEAHPGHTGVGGMQSPEYVRRKARFWWLLFRRHATAKDRVVFFLVGGPYTALRMLGREIGRGNFAPLRALFRRQRRDDA